MPDKWPCKLVPPTGTALCKENTLTHLCGPLNRTESEDVSRKKGMNSRRETQNRGLENIFFFLFKTSLNP